MKQTGIAIIGCGGITLQNHLPGLALCPAAKITALCDADPTTLEHARRQTGVTITSTDYQEIVGREDIQAVIIATPNVFHAPIALAGTGELGDMLSHRIDFAHLLVGPMKRLGASMKQWHPLRGCTVNHLDDWVAPLAEFQNGATGVLESSKLASGRNESWRSLDYVELNGSERSFVFITGEWNKLQTGIVGGPGMETITIPEEFWKVPGSARDPRQGDPLVTFRYDQAFEFIDAILNQRSCSPNFHDGVRVQVVIDAALKSTETLQWVEVENSL